MTYPEAIEHLRSLQVFGLHLGLESTRWLAGRCGDPQTRLQFIHVAGTNGKGSVCAMLEAMHRRAGRRVGLYTSPHLISFGERIQINRQPIGEADVVRWVKIVCGHVEDGAQTPTFFEFVTVMALGYFAEQGCDLVVWETGLGGRLDATNIVTPLASVITNIDLEHQQWLGSTHEAIAAEKAGIIKSGRPVITAARPGQGLEVIADTARRHQCALTVVDPSEGLGSTLSDDRGVDPALTVVPVARAWAWAAGGDSGSAGDWPTLALAGQHQRTNAAVALATVVALAGEWPVSVAAMRAGLETVRWPGRMQRVRGANGQEILLDGAHNPASAGVLRAALAEVWPGVRPTLILGVLADKDWEPMTQTLLPVVSRILAVPVGNQRTLAPEALMEACQRINPDAVVRAFTSLTEALAWAKDDPFVVITGSLYLVGEALEFLAGIVPTSSERALNEWGKGTAR